MEKQLEIIFKELAEGIKTGNTHIAYETVAKINEIGVTAKAVKPMFMAIETYPSFDWGNPGAFAHFIEKIPNYESELIESIERKPTANTTFLLYRIINSVEGDKRVALTTSMRNILLSPKADKDTLESATEFLEWIKEDDE